MSTSAVNTFQKRMMLAMAASYLSLILILLIALTLVLNSFGLTAVWGYPKILLINVLVFTYYSYNIACLMIMSLSFYIIDALNQLLEVRIKSNDEPSEDEMRQFMRNSCKIHDVICEMLESLSIIYTINSLTVYLGFMYGSVFWIFGIFAYFQAPSSHAILLIATMFVWNLQFIPYVFWSVTYSSWIERDGRRTVDLMRRFMYHEKYLDCIRGLDTFYQQVIHRSPFVSVLIDRINWIFFFTILSGIFSYSIILIQFSDIAL